MTLERFKAEFDQKRKCNDQDIIQVLNILHGRGLVLYYRKENKEQTPIVWLYPDKVLEKIHEVLIEQFKLKKQIEKVPSVHFSEDFIEDEYSFSGIDYLSQPTPKEEIIYFVQKERTRLDDHYTTMIS